MKMTRDQIITELLSKIPAGKDSHVMWWMMDLLAKGKNLPFLDGLITSLQIVEGAAPGYATMQVKRLAEIPLPIDDNARESLYQILGEIYCTRGAAEKADILQTKALLTIEPGTGSKNPEFESCSDSKWYAVEVKTPALIAYRRTRTEQDLQLTTRLPRELFHDKEKTLPRDNPVKDFLISADAKYAIYRQQREHAFRILTIVWDDYLHEAVAALISPVSGLLTANSFHRDGDGKPILFPNIDGVVLCRYQHWIVRAFRNDPMDDPVYGPIEFLDYHEPEPPKAFIQNPSGRTVPGGVLTSLNARPIAQCKGAEYSPVEMIMWINLDE
jgi:hypothetical protein